MSALITRLVRRIGDFAAHFSSTVIRGSMIYGGILGIWDGGENNTGSFEKREGLYGFDVDFFPSILVKFRMFYGCWFFYFFIF